MEGQGCHAGGKKEDDGKKDGACGAKKSCGTGERCCGKLVAGALLGGIILFAVISASWMLLPFHAQSLHGFKDEKAVAKVLLDNAPEQGIYVLPHMADMSKAPGVTAPSVFASVLPSGYDPAAMTTQMAAQFGLCVLLALLLTCLLKKQGSGCPVALSFKVGLLVALAHNLPNMIWWNFPLDFTLISAADEIVGITLAGALISKCVLKCGKTGVCPGCGCTDCKCKSGGGCGTESKGTCGA